MRDFIGRRDYQTLIDTLDYLERLGINAIEFMPINEFEANKQVVNILTSDENLYSRGQCLVEIVRPKQTIPALAIRQLPKASLREKISRWCTFIEIKDDEEEGF